MFDFDFELWKYVYTYDLDNMFDMFKNQFNTLYNIEDRDREKFFRYLYDISS